MKQPKQNFLDFLRSPFGTILIVVVFFYAVTFAVYYFYSPGPEERRQAEREIQNRLMTQELQSVLSTQQTL
ncbi:MAG: hypothetical protein U0519_02725 [Candidatus Gracilibacteria bacterium]